ncbi:Hypothetical protein BQ3484_75 [Cedratvirus A11]|uniref:Uncharacterized protein n=1 Tax=Cedratvirus A11 TaxID=1903266 RepID=A0A1M7XTX8_9VIRU|nr:Hypothetical protein BQ3484_75 [Cedratvirus A11]SHO33143.1 Hypothetical protein BQ3484_75 [Cedratvirus A11]
MKLFDRISFFFFFLRALFLAKIYEYLFPVRRIGNVLQVTYYEGQIKRQVHLPNALSLSPSVMAYVVKDGEKIDITQSGNVPFLVSCSDFGAEKLVICDLEDDQIYRGRQIPGKKENIVTCNHTQDSTDIQGCTHTQGSVSMEGYRGHYE